MATRIPYLDEVWRPVPGFDGYHVTEDGRLVGPAGHELSPMAADSGHLYVMASVCEERRQSKGRNLGRRQRKLFVHRAVLLAFVGPPPAGMEGLHMDGDPSHNSVGNLNWGTRLENMADKKRHGTEPTGADRWCSKLTDAERCSIRGLYNVVGGFTSRQLAEMFGVTHTTILRVARGG